MRTLFVKLTLALILAVLASAEIVATERRTGWFLPRSSSMGRSGNHTQQEWYFYVSLGGFTSTVLSFTPGFSPVEKHSTFENRFNGFLRDTFEASSPGCTSLITASGPYSVSNNVVHTGMLRCRLVRKLLHKPIEIRHSTWNYRPVSIAIAAMMFIILVVLSTLDAIDESTKRELRRRIQTVSRVSELLFV